MLNSIFTAQLYKNRNKSGYHLTLGLAQNIKVTTDEHDHNYSPRRHHRKGMGCVIDSDMAMDDIINEGVRRAYKHPDNVLRASILADPDGARKNTGDNTPAVIHYKMVPGNTIDIHVAAKPWRLFQTARPLGTLTSPWTALAHRCKKRQA